jgi:hypothetical protein
MKLFLFFLLAGSALRFDVTDSKGKHASGVTIEAGDPDADGWSPIHIAKGKVDLVLVWPFEARVKAPDGPEPIPVIVIPRGEEKALTNPHVVAAIAAPVVLGVSTIDERSRETGFTVSALTRAITGLISSPDAFASGVGLLFSNKAAEAADKLALGLRERQRQLTRVPSDIYPAAMIYGHALMLANKFDAAAVAFMAALKERPSSQDAREARTEALVKAGKPEAAGVFAEPRR